MKLPKIKIDKIKSWFTKVPRILGEHAFLTFLIFLFLSLIFGGFLFYKYNILAQRAEPEILREPIQFKKEAYEKILENWQTREKRFKETEFKEYPNPFKMPISATTSVPEEISPETAE